MDALSLLFDIQKQLGQVAIDVSGIKSDLTHVCTQSDKHDREIYGNGKKGLKDIVGEIRLRVSIYSALGGLVGSTITIFCLEFIMRKMLHAG